MNNNQFMDFINIVSLALQLQNSEALKIDSLRDDVESKLDNDIIKRLDHIIKQLDDLTRLIKNNLIY